MTFLIAPDGFNPAESDIGRRIGVLLNYADIETQIAMPPGFPCQTDNFENSCDYRYDRKPLSYC